MKCSEDADDFWRDASDARRLLRVVVNRRLHREVHVVEVDVAEWRLGSHATTTSSHFTIITIIRHQRCVGIYNLMR